MFKQESLRGQIHCIEEKQTNVESRLCRKPIQLSFKRYPTKALITMQWIINNKATLKETEEMFWPVQNAAEFYWIFPQSGEDGREIDERRE